MFSKLLALALLGLAASVASGFDDPAQMWAAVMLPGVAALAIFLLRESD